MLELTLREEFRGRRLKGTAIELETAKKMSAGEFLDITYPSGDVVKSVEAVGPEQGRPLVMIGERGQGKSHLMAVLDHAFNDPAATQSWLAEWGDRLDNPKISALPLRESMHVISESLHKQSYKFLWDLLFDRHPHGAEVRGMWKGQGEKQTDVPGEKLLLELFQHTPCALILDEFQTWFDGLSQTKRTPYRVWAFNFIQLLSEIAKEHPDLLVLVVSVRNGSTDAFQQIQRVSPVLVDFKGPNAKSDRQRLLLHRLFENRIQVPEGQITDLLSAHVSEYLRLMDVPPSEHERCRQEFIEGWPFAPHLMQLLEDQVLVATDAQETRDLIRILAQLYKRHGEARPLITAADFRIDDDKSGITALIDSVANQHHQKLREKAQRNLEAVRDAVQNPDQNVPHLEEIIGALWLRSLVAENLAGAIPQVLHVDITRDKPVDDNAFEAELAAIVENSFNIHQDGDRLIFREEENPQAKLIASARNDKLFEDGRDLAQLALEVRYVLSGQSEVAKTYQVIVLPRPWTSDPWTSLEESEQPQQWGDRIPILVLPQAPESLEQDLGRWLKEHLQSQRNAVRFLIPRAGSDNLFYERDVLVLARAVSLAKEWKAQNSAYRKLETKYEGELRGILKKRFDRFAILATWSFQNPEQCTFYVEGHQAEGEKIPDAVDEKVRKDLFVAEDFDALVKEAAQSSRSVGELLRELREPRPGGADCIPWLGETLMKERLIRVCARGEIALNLRNLEFLQRRAGEDDEGAWQRMKGKLGTGKHLDETTIMLPQAVPHAEGGVVPQPGGDVPPTPAGGGDGGTPVPGSGDGGGAPTPDPGGIFGGGKALKPYVSPATSPLNLLGQVETWGIGTGTQVQGLALKVSQLTGAQLSDLLKRLPDGITYELALNKEED